MFQGHQSDGNIHGNVMGISFHRNILLGYDGIHVVIILWVVVYQRVYIYISCYIPIINSYENYRTERIRTPSQPKAP
jgi:hypothetical protein